MLGRSFSLTLIGVAAWVAHLNPNAWATSADDLLDRASKAFEAGNAGQGERLLQALVKAQPDFELAWLNLGRYYLELGRWEEAARSLEKIPAGVAGPRFLARVLLSRAYQSWGDPLEAHRVLRELASKSLEKKEATLVQTGILSARRELLRAAIAHYDRADYGAAFADLKELETTGLDRVSRLLLGAVLVRQGKAEEARSAIREADALFTGSDEWAKIARDLVGELDSLMGAQAPSVWNGNAELSFGYNSNVNATGESQAGTKEREERRALPLGLLAAELRSPERAGLSLGFRGRWFELGGQPAARWVKAGLEVGFLVGGTSGSWNLRVAPELSQEWLGSSVYFRRLGGKLLFQFGGDRTLSELLVDFQINQALREEYRYLEGHVSSVGLAHEARWSSIAARGFATWVREWNHDFEFSGGLFPLRYSGIRLGVAIEGSADGGWRFAVVPSWMWKFFDSIEVPDLIERVDLQISVSLRAQRPVTGAVDWFAETSYLRNQSTLGPESVINKDFHQWAASSGVSVRY